MFTDLTLALSQPIRDRQNPGYGLALRSVQAKGPAPEEYVLFQPAKKSGQESECL